MRSVSTPAWGVILAGGDGTRLRPLTQHLSGDARPKQFCRLLGEETLLDATRRRADRVIRPDRQLVVVSRSHAPYYADLARELLPGRLVVQPQNRGTAPAILLGALAIRSLAGDAPMVVLPSDHDVEDDAEFMTAVADAVAIVQTRRDRAILLGVEPATAETEYGWIQPVPTADSKVAPIRQFWEKPSRALAHILLERGYLWNTFVMVGWASAFESLVYATEAELAVALGAVAPLLGTRAEAAALEHAYASLPTLGFADRVLTRAPERLAVMRVKNAGWCDLGNLQRVAEAARRRGDAPGWLSEPLPLSA